MKAPRKRRKFSEHFRRKIIRSYRSGITVKDLSLKHEIPRSTIYSWIRRYSNMGFKAKPISSKDDKEILNKQMRDMQIENEFLKEVLLYLLEIRINLNNNAKKAIFRSDLNNIKVRR